MAKKSPPCKEASEDVTRESLIALSYSLPDKVLTSKLSPENPKKENAVGQLGSEGAADEYRSELISISYPQSPDIKVLPVEG